MLSENNKIVQFNSDAKHRLPPHNIDAEMAVLGGIMLDAEAFPRAEPILRPEMFYVAAHSIVYRAMQRLSAAGRPTNLMFVTNELANRELLDQAGGRSGLAAIYDSTVSAVNIDKMATIIRDKWVRRQLIKAGNDIGELGYQTEAELADILDEAERKLFAVTTNDSSIQYCAQAPDETLMRIWNRLEQGGEPPFLKTGLYDLDMMIGGLRQGDLDIVAGRASTGKTQFGVFLAYQVAFVYKQPVVFFTAEMSQEKLMCRFLALDSEIDSSHLLNNRINDRDWTKLAASLDNLTTIPLRIDDHPNPSPSHIRSQVQRVKSEFGRVGLIVLDYLQLLGGSSGSANRVQELDLITKQCKAIAKEFEAPFLALAQVNRGVEDRNNKRPLISDLRESGGLEQAADLILLLYRDDYYNSDSQDAGLIEIAVGKNRDGQTGVAKFIFQPSLSRFLNLVK